MGESLSHVRPTSPDAHPRHIQGRIAHQMDEGVAVGQQEQDCSEHQPGAPAIEHGRTLLRARERFGKGRGLQVLGRATRHTSAAY